MRIFDQRTILGRTARLLLLELALGVAVGVTDPRSAAGQGSEDVVLLQLGGAVERGELASFESLLEKWKASGRFSLRALEDKRLLRTAAQGNTAAHTTIVERLISLGMDPNDGSGQRSTPVHAAASGGNVATLRVLLLHGGRSDVSDDDGNTPLFSAVEGVDTAKAEVVRLLLERGGTVNARGVLGQTPLHWAARHNAALIPLLVERGAAVEATDGDGRTPLMLGHREAIRLLLAAGAQAQARDRYENTAMHWAALRGADAMRALADAGLAVDAQNSAGLTPAHFAALEGGPAAVGAVAYLHERGASLSVASTGPYPFRDPALNPRMYQPQIIPAGATPLSIAKRAHSDTKWSSGRYRALVDTLEKLGATSRGTRGGPSGTAAGATGGATRFAPLLIAPVSIVGFVAIFAALIQLDARMTGWHRMAERFAATGPEPARAIRQDAGVGTIGLVRVKNLMRAAAPVEGLYLAMPAVFRLGHPPLSIPWREMRIASDSVLFGQRVVRVTVGDPAIGKIWLRGGVAAEVPGRLR
jgi:ankyrin repeat protein